MTILFKNMDEATKKIVSQIATDDIRVNKIGFNKTTNYKETMKIIDITKGLLRGDNKNG